ncbi:hypothetical protein AMAG_03616 [Allomyces macrogynus ATCC 38327]|uniref:Uncharacterized protein n=1 Tax=Allomyces macrogynus (strain ATCC 38327) TaxID=578462 RepID=A0A0L0S9N7_ALLM3|nr:hypothetical protein AMAG_03616 [Allomyces macrogynus ATCC 38327]|eukprot:KNE59313.1 hypothetical protein AMAG_03616 [Allomyces macrogynus ATCC 38327]
MNRVPAILSRRIASVAGIRPAVRTVPALAAVQARSAPVRPMATAPQDAVPGPTSSGRRDYGTPQEEDSPWSIPMYLLSGALISGSIYYANNATLKPEDLYGADADPHAVYGPVSEQALADDATERALLTFGDTLWARLQNWWTYPAACRRATVLNNLADDLIMLAYLARREAEGATTKDVAERATRRSDAHLSESIKVLQRALDASSGAAKKSPECGACRVAVLNNLGRAEEEAGEPVAAAKYLHKALAEARTLGLVDARREVQVNLTRVQEQVSTGRKRD